MTTRVYEYGALPPTENLELVRKQMRLAHEYSNKLTEIERERRERVQQAQVGHADVAPLAAEVQQLELELETVRERISKTRQKNRESRAPAADLAAARDLRKRLKDTRVRLREAKARARGDVEVADKLRDAEEWSRDAIRRARADFSARDLYWGSYLTIEAAADSARKSVTPPRFKRWDGRGHLAVQFQKGLPVNELMAQTDTRARLRPPPPEAFMTAEERDAFFQSQGRPREGDPGYVGRRPAMRTEIKLRVGSAGAANREPVWTTLPIVMHRPIREGAVLKWAHLICERVADEEHWRVQLVADESECPERKDPKLDKERGDCGIDFGWRLLPDGALRVAALIGKQRPDDPAEPHYDETVVLPRWLLEKDEHTDALRATRSKIFDEVRPRLAEWALSVTFPEGSFGAKVREHVGKWRDPQKVRRLFDEHRDLMPQSDVSETNPYGNLKLDVEKFLESERHLWRWEANERKKVLDQRREMYRLWAVDVARYHRRVAVEHIDLRDFAQRGAPEEGARTDDRRYMRLRGFAAISTLRECLKQACLTRGVEFIEVEAAHTTQKCRRCGHVDADLKAAKEISVRCPACGREDDQDLRAAENILTLMQTSAPAGATMRQKSAMSKRQERFRKNAKQPAAAE